MDRGWTPGILVVAGALGLGCGPTVDPPTGSGSGSASGSGTDDTTVTATGPVADSGSSSSAGASSGGVTTASSGTGSEGSSSTGAPVRPPDCAGTIYECTNGRDDDGDGLFDLDDPECTSPCDDDEGSLANGLLHKLDDCRLDCAFDGNAGMGDDGCYYDLRCDPEEPGANLLCEFEGSPLCDDQPEPVDPQCVGVCEPYVPPGCDCFGCCEVDVDGVPTPIFLYGHPDCSFADLGSCTSCTPRIDECGNPCDAAGCEQCLGQTEPPPGCETNVCDTGDPCETSAECGDGGYCLLGCCYPPSAG